MTDAQIWLNQNIPVNQRVNIRELRIWPDSLLGNSRHFLPCQDTEKEYYIPSATSLTGTLDLSTFPSLEGLTVEGQLISRLILSKCYLLERLNANDNLLREIVWPNRLIVPGAESGVEWASRLESVYLVDNNFFSQDLSEFSRFGRLKVLFLGTHNKEKIKQGIYNRWNGSLTSIRNLRELQELDINATDINDGLIDLPTEELFHFTFGSFGREEAGVNELKAIMVRDLEIESENVEEWAAVGTYGGDDSFDRCIQKVEKIKTWQRTQRQENRQLQAQIQVNNFR